MNITILNWRDPKHPLAGGAEISLLEHAKFWSKKGAKVTWFASNYNKAPFEETINEIKIIRKGNHYTVHLWAFIYYIQKKLNSPDLIIDCFHFLPFFTPFYSKTKIIALINEPAKKAWFKNIFFPISLIGYILEPFFFIPYKKTPFITSSESIARELVNYKLNKKMINIIYHGTQIIDQKNINYEKEKTPTIIYLAQLAPDKGIEDAIKAFYYILKKIPDAKFWIVGKTINEKYLIKIKKMIKNNKLEKPVTIYGFISETKKNELLQKAWLLIHPSLREGWGLNVIEANTHGTPAVGYNSVGLKDSIINNQTGLLVKKNTKALAQAIYNLITNKKMYQIMRIETKKWAKKFNWKTSGKKSWNLINKI